MRERVWVHIDATAGAAGDMLLAAALELLEEVGAEEALQDWHRAMAPLLALDPHIEMRQQEVVRGGLRAKKIDFYIGSAHADHHHDHHARHLSDILQIFSQATDAGAFSPSDYELAAKIFTILGEAEASAHGIEIAKVHFHEVGALDSILDIAGFALAWNRLNVEGSSSTPVTTGVGMVEMAHGTLRVPPPAVVEILKRHQIPCTGLEIPGECLTPTGAACLAAVVDRYTEATPAGIIRAQGVGAGSREHPQMANAVRMYAGKM